VVSVVAGLLGCDTVLKGKKYVKFLRIIMPSSLGSNCPKRMASCSAMHRHTPEDMSLLLLVIYNYSLNVFKTHNAIVYL
jgi:hypothetical protein